MEFNQLTPRGQTRRLRALAQAALAEYDLQVRDLRLLGRFTNVLFRVRTTEASYVLRVCTPGWRTDTDLLSEAMWLQALQKEPQIGAPRPVAATDGRFLVWAGAEGVPDGRRCVLMSWVPGVPLGKRLDETNLFRMGVLFARMHAQGASFVPPPGFTQRVMDGIYARGEPDVLLDPAQEETLALPPQARRVLEQTQEQVNRVYRTLCAGPEKPRVIHNDLWHDNIKVCRGRLHPLDFEDTVWGYPVHDLAMAIQDLMLDVPPEAFAPLRAALRAGYETLAPWPERQEGQIDTLRAGRLLWVANYVARFEQRHLPGHIEWTMRFLEPYLQTGQLLKG